MSYSILDNIQALPAYGVKYQLTFGSRSGNRYQVEILERGYGGLVSNLVGHTKPLTINHSFVDGDVFRPIAGTMYELSFISDYTNQFNELRYASNKQYLLKFYKVESKTPILQGVGYITPQTYQQHYKALKQVVTISFSDNLGTLKDHKFLHNDDSYITGIYRISDIISFILWKIGMTSQYWYDAIPIRPQYLGNKYAGCLFNTYVDCYRFRDKNCQQVLTDLLESHVAQICSYKDSYLIRNVDYPAVTWASTILRTGELFEHVGVSLQKTHRIGVDSEVNSSLDLKAEIPAKDIELVFVQDKIKNLFENRTPYVHFDPEIMSQWNPNNFPMVISRSLVILKPWYINQIIGNPYFRTPQVNIQFHNDFPHKKGYFKLTLKVRLASFRENPTRLGATVYFGFRFLNNWQVFWPEEILGFNSAKTIERVIYLKDYDGILIFSMMPAAPDPVDDLWYIEYSDWKLIAVKDSAGTEYSDNIKKKTSINDENPKSVSLEKYYGHDSIEITNPRDPYIYYNNLICKRSGEYEVIRNHKFITNGGPMKLPDFTMERYITFYALNKIRVSGTLFSRLYAYEDYILFPYTKMEVAGLDQHFLIASYSWDVRQDSYGVELIGYASKPWVLATGSWDDYGVWIDTEIWDEI